MTVLDKSRTKKSGLWGNLSPQKKQFAIIAGVVVSFIVIAYPMLSNNPPAVTQKKQSIDNILTGADPRELGIGGIAQQVQKQQGEIADLKKQLDAKEKQ